MNSTSFEWTWNDAPLFYTKPNAYENDVFASHFHALVRSFYKGLRTCPNLTHDSIVPNNMGFSLTCGELAIMIIRRNHAKREQELTNNPR